MRKILTLCFLLLITHYIFAQEIKLSALPDNSKKEAEKVVSKFIKAIKGNNDLTPFITSNEANYGGAIWMPTDEFIRFLKPILPSPIKNSSFKYYTFDEVEQDSLVKNKAIKLNRVYNNFSIFALGTINEKKVSLILQPNEDKLKIYSLNIAEVGLAQKNIQNIVQTDTLKDINIALKIPNGFSKTEEQNGQVTYIMRGETPRDAAIQIMYFEKRAPINIISYKWVEHITSSYRKSEYEISYLPNGYIYKYELIDQDDNLNKGISVGIENSEYSILIQYFAFKNVYNTHWFDIDQMIRNIKIL